MARPQNPILHGRIEGGRIAWHGVDAKRWTTMLKFLEGQDVEITIGRRPKRRSLSQNRYMWGVVYAMIAEAAGYTPEEAHEALKWRFLRHHGDGPIPTVRSTTDLTTTEMEEYLAQCRQLAAELFGLYIPDPNEVLPDSIR
jgi:hypothetical protein